MWIMEQLYETLLKTGKIYLPIRKIDGMTVNAMLYTYDKDFYFEANIIDGTCYRLYKFKDMDNKSKSIEIYVQVSRVPGSIFHTLQPELAGDENIDISEFCESY